MLAYIRKGLQTMAEGPADEPPVAPPSPKLTERTGVRVFRVPGMNDSVVVNLSSFDTTMVGALTQLGQRIEEQVRQNTAGARHAGRNVLLSSAWQLMSTGQFDAAAGILRKVVEESPENPVAWDMLVRSQVASGDLDGVLDVAAAWSTSGAPDAPDASSVQGLQTMTRREGMRGYWRWRLQRLEARESAGEDVPRVELATAHAALGDDDQALKLLAEAFGRGERGLFTIQFDPAWDRLRNDSRFVEMAREARDLRYSPAMRGGRPGGGGRR